MTVASILANFWKLPEGNYRIIYNNNGRLSYVGRTKEIKDQDGNNCSANIELDLQNLESINKSAQYLTSTGKACKLSPIAIDKTAYLTGIAALKKWDFPVPDVPSYQPVTLRWLHDDMHLDEKAESNKTLEMGDIVTLQFAGGHYVRAPLLSTSEGDFVIEGEKKFQIISCGSIVAHNSVKCTVEDISNNLQISGVQLYKDASLHTKTNLDRFYKKEKEVEEYR